MKEVKHIFLVFCLIVISDKVKPSARHPAISSKKIRPRDVKSVFRMKYLTPRNLDETHFVEPELVSIPKELKIQRTKNTNDGTPSHNNNNNNNNSIAAFWNTWSDWSECSRTCGGGVTTRKRLCISRAIDLKCDGHSIAYNLCNTEKCPNSSAEFRDEQCSGHNDEIYHSRKFEWLSYSNADGFTCELLCMARNLSIYRSFGLVYDGTTCGNRGVCVNGKCLDIGCDGVLGSEKKNDMCGVCGGRNLECTHINKSVTRLSALEISSDYHEIVEFPAGSANIIIKDFNENYLALIEIGKDGEEESVVNWNWIINFPGVYKATGVTVRYGRIGAQETLEIQGPTQTILRLMVLVYRKQPWVTFEYWLPNFLSNGLAALEISHTGHLKLTDEGDRIQIINAGLNITQMNPPTNVATTLASNPTTISSTNSYTIKMQAQETHSVKTDRCRRARTANEKRKTFCDSDVVIFVRLLRWRRAIRGRFTRFEVEVLETYKRNLKLSRREYIWIQNACLLKPKLMGYYIIMGKGIKIVKRKTGYMYSQDQHNRTKERMLFSFHIEEVSRYRSKNRRKIARIKHANRCKRPVEKSKKWTTEMQK